MIDSLKTTGQITDDAGAAAIVALVVSGCSSVAFQVIGTFTGTVTFEGTVNNDTWVALSVGTSAAFGTRVTTATAAGLWLSSCGGLHAVRVRCTSYTSGVPEVSIAATPGGGV